MRPRSGPENGGQRKLTYGPVSSGCPLVSVPEPSPKTRPIFIYIFSFRFQHHHHHPHHHHQHHHHHHHPHHHHHHHNHNHHHHHPHHHRIKMNERTANQSLYVAFFILGDPFVGYECFYSSHVRRASAGPPRRAPSHRFLANDLPCNYINNPGKPEFWHRRFVSTERPETVPSGSSRPIVIK